jgi:hypothetical protein
METIRQTERMSPLEMKRALLWEIWQVGQGLLRRWLERLDEELFLARDRSRYEVKELRERALETLLGPVRFRRRYYLDRERKAYVALLGRALGIEEGARVSPGMSELAVVEGWWGRRIGQRRRLWERCTADLW